MQNLNPLICSNNLNQGMIISVNSGQLHTEVNFNCVSARLQPWESSAQLRGFLRLRMDGTWLYKGGVKKLVPFKKRGIFVIFVVFF